MAFRYGSHGMRSPARGRIRLAAVPCPPTPIRHQRGLGELFRHRYWMLGPGEHELCRCLCTHAVLDPGLAGCTAATGRAILPHTWPADDDHAECTAAVGAGRVEPRGTVNAGEDYDPPADNIPGDVGHALVAISDAVVHSVTHQWCAWRRDANHVGVDRVFLFLCAATSGPGAPTVPAADIAVDQCRRDHR
ncbi:Uncharacterised protein [Mycobacteroides abscessus subsp. abscessus]|nr:Uncharacterised protein [Mycobacteroides abscessus subsp. abscessus]